MIKSKVGLYPPRAQTAFTYLDSKVYQNLLKQMRKKFWLSLFFFARMDGYIQTYRDMNYKLDYITRMLTKIAHKRLESYVIHRIWNNLDNPDVHFVFQQYVVRKEGKYALADLYLPQINLVVEIDEPAHFNNKEADAIREKEITSHTDVERVKCYDVVGDNAVPCSLEELNKRTDRVTEIIKYKISQLGSSFRPWKGVDTVEDIQSRGSLRIKDNVSFYTISDIAAVFSRKPKPRSSAIGIPGKPDEIVWWPITKHKVWDNSISEDGFTITETTRDPSKQESHMRQHIGSREKRITFLCYKDWLGITSYRFMGVFQINPTKSEEEKKCIWERISDTYNLTKPL